MEKGFVWQCKCGHVSYEEMPDDCEQCLAVNSFNRIPEDQIEEAMAEEVLAMKGEDDE